MFDKSFQKYTNDPKLQELMSEAGVSIYDLITVDGVSLADKAEEKGLDLNSQDPAIRAEAENAMKAYCMGAGLKPEADMAFIPLIRGGSGKILAGDPHPLIRDGQLKAPEVTGIKRLFKNENRFRENDVKFQLTQSQEAKESAIRTAKAGDSYGRLLGTLEKKMLASLRISLKKICA